MATLLQRFFGMAAALGSLGMTACFIEPAAPGAFRFECSADVECDADQRCASGLCQQPCGGDEVMDCPQEAPVCLNGYCSSVCLVAEPECSSPQTCLSFTFPGEQPAENGVCAVACSDEAPCPAGQLCYDELGLCVTACTTTDECASGEECALGFCVPSSSSGRGG